MDKIVHNSEIQTKLFSLLGFMEAEWHDRIVAWETHDNLL